MGTKMLMVAAAMLAASSAQAAGNTVLQDNDCRIIRAEELTQAIGKAEKDTGLRLAKDMGLRVEVHCMQDGGSKRYLYSVSAAVEKMVNDGEVQRWATVAHTTGYGTAAGSAALLQDVRFTVRDVIRQEP